MSFLRRAPNIALLVIAATVAIACGSATSDPSSGTSTPRPTDTDAASPTPPTSSATPSPATSSTTVKDGEPWIVYQHFDGQAITLRLIGQDGHGDHQLLTGATADPLHPDWSPDGRQIAFAMDNDLWIVDAAGSDPHRLFDCAKPCEFGDAPTWSPDGLTIAYLTGMPVGEIATQSVIAVDVATGTTRILFHTDGPDYPTYVRWSPDGTSIVLDVARFPDAKVGTTPIIGEAIAVLDLTATKPMPRYLTDWAMFATYPDWSWTTDTIVFSTYDLGSRDFHVLSAFEPPSDLYTIDPDGSDLTQLTHNASGPSLIRNDTASGPLSCQPTWTPDGTSVIFTQVDGETWPGWELSTVAADGSGLAPATGSTVVVGSHPRLRPTP